MTLFDPSEIEVDIDSGGNTVVHHGNVMVQVRRGSLTPKVLDRVEATARLIRARLKGPVAAIVVLEHTALIQGREMRVRQRTVLRDLLSDGRTHIVVVIDGAGVGAQMMRIVARTLLPSDERVRVARDSSSAAEWLSPRIERPTEELTELVDHARALGDPAP